MQHVIYHMPYVNNVIFETLPDCLTTRLSEYVGFAWAVIQHGAKVLGLGLYCVSKLPFLTHALWNRPRSCMITWHDQKQHMFRLNTSRRGVSLQSWKTYFSETSHTEPAKIQHWLQDSARFVDTVERKPIPAQNVWKCHRIVSTYNFRNISSRLEKASDDIVEITETTMSTHIILCVSYTVLSPTKRCEHAKKPPRSSETCSSPIATCTWRWIIVCPKLPSLHADIVCATT